MAVFPEGEPPFVTQLYIKDNPGNNSDFLFNRIPVERRHMVVADFAPASKETDSLQASFDIVLDRYQGTPLDKSG